MPVSQQPESWAPAALPYICDDALHPGELPTAEEIRSSTTSISQRSGQKVVTVGTDFVAKFGTNTEPREGQALLYLEKYVSEFPAPRLYAMFYDGKELFIIMQRVPGVQLDVLWESMSDVEKTLVTKRLHNAFDLLRSSRCPWPDFYGSLDGSSVPHHIFFDHGGRKSITGPFTGEPAFNAGMIAQYRDIQAINNRQDFKAAYYETNLNIVLSGHKPTLSHSDVQKKNIVVKEIDPHGESSHRTFEIAVVDWEFAGWYPDYWEYFTMFADFQWTEDWSIRAGEILDPWPAESAIMKIMYNDLWF